MMIFRMFSLSAIAVALLVVNSSAFAAKEAAELTHLGKVVSITGNRLVMTDQQGREHSHTLTTDAKLTLDGKTCQAIDLKPGTRIRVTTEGAEHGVANRIEGIEKRQDFANSRRDGKLVSIRGNQLVMTNLQGQEHAHTLTADAQLTLDGQVCQAVDLKPGTRIRVTTEGGEQSVANRIEGCEKDPSFASDSHDGKLVSVTGNQLVMTYAKGKAEHTCTLTADVQITCDGQACQSSDLRPGMKIRVTSESGAPHAAVRVEALDKNLKFASL